MKEWPVGARVVLLAGSACILFAAMAGLATRDDPYAPNDWLFSHAFLAQRALEEGKIPLNRDLFTANGFSETSGPFREDVGLTRMSFYANTIWHFWNGLPLQPSLLAAVSALTGLAPEEAARAPLGGITLVLLVFAAADRLLAGRDRPVAALAAFALPLCSAPLVLDMRVLMPSTSLVIVAMLMLLLVRRQFAGDKAALAAAMVPLALLPFWYYTVTYFVIALFAGFLALAIVQRHRARDAPPVVPILVAACVPVVLGGALLLNGALTSHLQMAGSLGSLSLLGGEAGGDYSKHLNRQPWRSAVLYVQILAFFAPLGLLALRGLSRDHAARPEATFTAWSLGAAAFSSALLAAVGVSFLNRGVIYLTPLAALALAYAAARARWGRVVGVGALALGIIMTPALVASAGPSYSRNDASAFGWMETHVPRDAVVYSSLDVASVLFRAHGYQDALAFHPRTRLLEDFWYGDDPEKMVPYLASVEWFVLRDDVKESGFEEFGPLREPISEAAYEKFDASADLHLVYDAGGVKVYRVELAPERYHDV